MSHPGTSPDPAPVPDTEIAQLRKDLQDSRDELARTKQDLTGTQNQADELRRQKDVIVKCLNLAGELARTNGGTAAKRQEAQKVCDEAERYLV